MSGDNKRPPDKSGEPRRPPDRRSQPAGAPVDEGLGQSERIALLIGSEGNRLQMARQLARHHVVIESATGDFPEEEFDLAIVDGPGLKRWHDHLAAARKREELVFLPVMMVLPRPDLRRQAGKYLDLVDEFITTPIDRQEFLERTDILLRARRQSLEQREQLSYIANYDRDTGLPTQALFLDRVEAAIQHARTSGEKVHVIAMHFPMAHLMRSLGPAALPEIVNKSIESMRATVTEDIYLARLATEQGAILAPPGASTDEVTDLCQQVTNAIRRPIEVNGEKIRLSVSMGVSRYPDDAGDANGMLTAALAALEGAGKRETPHFYSGKLQERALRHLRIENGLHRALDGDELELWYQPQFRLDNLELVGAEALIRWRLPSGELVPPGEFIPVAENSGLIRKIGTWVIETACTVMERWQDSGFRCPRMAVNVTPADLMAPNFVSWLKGKTRDNGLEPTALEIELTETTLLDVDETIFARLQELRDLGIKVAIDDFGTGYSSLGYLHRLPVDCLKIDKSFTDRIPGDEAGEAITGAIIGLAKHFDLELVAEGIETQRQFDYLKTLDVDYGQGFLVGRPLPETEFIEHVNKGLRAKE